MASYKNEIVLVFIVIVLLLRERVYGHFCKDPDTGRLHKVNTSWQSTTFCGNYSCLFTPRNKKVSERTSFDQSVQEGVSQNKTLDNEDRYLNEEEIEAINSMLHSIKKSELDNIIHLYNIALETGSLDKAVSPYPGCNCIEDTDDLMITPENQNQNVHISPKLNRGGVVYVIPNKQETKPAKENNISNKKQGKIGDFDFTKSWQYYAGSEYAIPGQHYDPEETADGGDPIWNPNYMLNEFESTTPSQPSTPYMRYPYVFHPSYLNKEDQVPKPDWQTNPLDPNLLEEVRSHEKPKGHALLGKILNMKRIKRTNAERKKRSVDVPYFDDNKQQTHVVTITCPFDLEPGFFKQGDMSLPFPECCPKRISLEEMEERRRINRIH